MSARTASRLAWSLWALSLVFAIAGAVLLVLNVSITGVTIALLPLLFGGSVLYPLLGAVIASRRPTNSIGWLLSAAGLGLGLSLFAMEYALFGFVTARVLLPGATFLAWLNAWLPQLITFASFLLFALLFPDGRPPSPRWRPLVWIILAGACLNGVVNILLPVELVAGNQGIRHEFSLTSNPTGVPTLRPFLNGFQTILGIWLNVTALASVSGLGYRFVRGRGEERQQLKWLAYAAAFLCLDVLVAVLLSLVIHSQVVGDIAWTLGAYVVIFGFPTAATVAIVKHRLYDIDLVINKSLVFGTLALFITAVYVGIVVGIGALVGAGGRPNLALSILATAIVAVAFQPVRERVERFANRLVYGKRATPYEVLSQFSHRVAGTYASEEILPRMAQVLAEGTAAARADVWLRLGDQIAPAASWPFGDEPAPASVAVTGQLLPPIPDVTRVIPVRHQGELLGALSINTRTGEALTPVEADLLKNLAAQAGLVLRNVRLTAELRARLQEISRQAAELRASRQRIVAAQDAERRRLERNIHDGAQQNLVALTVKLRLATNLAKRDPERARVSVKALEAESDQALGTLRALARGIYPPLLREQGLVAAVRAEAEKMAVPANVGADHIDRFAPDVEGAVYFVCLEALQNVTKHANASHVQITLHSRKTALSFDITDDGTGFDVTKDAKGSGLRNMTDRIEAMDGRLVIRSEANQGTTVSGTVPIETMAAVS